MSQGISKEASYDAKNYHTLPGDDEAIMTLSEARKIIGNSTVINDDELTNLIYDLSQISRGFISSCL